MTGKTLMLIFNPKSGKGDMVESLYAVIDLFTKNGFEVTVHPTQAQGDAAETILHRGGAFEYLVCSGGDGTLNETINALMRMEKRPVFGYIPSGTTNDFATSLGLPKDPLRAAKAICTGSVYSLDVGQFADKYFSYVAAFGLFTDIPYDTPQDMKNIFGHAAYILEGAKRLASIQTYHCTVNCDGVEYTEEYILGMVANSTSIGGFQMFSESVIALEDGLFEVLLIRKPKHFIDLQNIIASLLNRESYTDSLVHYHASRITLSCTKEIPWTLDGEFGGTWKNVTIQNCHKALDIILPQSSPYLPSQPESPAKKDGEGGGQ